MSGWELGAAWVGAVAGAVGAVVAVRADRRAGQARTEAEAAASSAADARRSAADALGQLARIETERRADELAARPPWELTYAGGDGARLRNISGRKATGIVVALPGAPNALVGDLDGFDLEAGASRTFLLALSLADPAVSDIVVTSNQYPAPLALALPAELL